MLPFHLYLAVKLIPDADGQYYFILRYWLNNLPPDHPDYEFIKKLYEKKRRYRKYDPEKVKTLFLKYKNMSEVARILNTYPSTIYYILKRIGLK
ncbi:MAG: helix-turn-helix domain-containing protein [Candidatus Baldrarchaeia archaeon]